MKRKFSLVVVFSACFAFALQGGPNQPDYTQFEPTGMQDMVSLLTGDFAYQVPLGEIPSPYGNYPLSVSYHAGISPQQEASWVGLGWSLNPGAINRNVRGVPDDQFHGGTMGLSYEYSKLQSWNTSLGVGVGPYSVGMSASSNGSVGYSASIGYEIAGGYKVGFGLNLSSDGIGASAQFGGDGAGVKASVNYSYETGKTYASVGANFSPFQSSNNVGFGKDVSNVGLTLSSDGSASGKLGPISAQRGKNGKSVSFSNGMSTVSHSSYANGNSKSESMGFDIVIPIEFVTISYGFSQTTSQYWNRSASSEYVYGYMYQAGPSIDVGKENGFSMAPEASAGGKEANTTVPWKWSLKGRTLETLGERNMYPAYDVYSVASEGVNGSFRPFARETHQMYRLVSDEPFDSKEKNFYTYTFVMDDSLDANKYIVQKTGEFNKNGEFFVKYADDYYRDYKSCVLQESGDTCSVYGFYETNYKNIGNRLVYNSKEDAFEERGGMHFLFMSDVGGYFESDDIGASKKNSVSKVSNKLLKRTIGGYDYALYGSKKIEPLFNEGEEGQTGKISGFVITAENGAKYFFEQPVNSILQIDYSINSPKGIPLVFVDKNEDVSENFFENLVNGAEELAKNAIENYPGIDYLIALWNGGSEFYKVPYRFFKEKIGSIVSSINGIFKGHLNEKCQLDSPYSTYMYTYNVNMNPHATQWLLTEIRGADFVKLSDNIDDNIGYNVKFHYSDPSLYFWRTPYARPFLESTELPNMRIMKNAFSPEGCEQKKFQASFGVKEYVYLNTIETSTHFAKFELNEKERVDGKGWYSDAAIIPILVQTSIGYEVSDVNTSKKSATLKPKYLYFNSPILKSIRKHLYTSKLKLIYDGKDFKDIDIGNGTKIKGSTKNKGVIYGIKDASYKKTYGEESVYGLYKVELVENDDPSISQDISVDFNGNLKNGDLFVVGESGHVKQNPYLDWSDVIFPKGIANNKNGDSKFENQMRYLESVKFYSKKNSDNPYKIYSFDYDYSLHPKTLNSYCLHGKNEDNFSLYPWPDSLAQISESPDSVGVDVCENAERPALYGKLTLRSITETGCQNGKCYSLPPYKFDYLSPKATSTRFGKKGEWISKLAYSIYNPNLDDAKDLKKMYEDTLFASFSDVDATIMASSNAVDEYGFWSEKATYENHSVDQDFADFGASAWSLNKIVEPTGSVIESEYERDVIANGETHGNERLNVPFERGQDCKNAGVSGYDGKLCLKLKRLYWREQCLGPRAAFWDEEKLDGDESDGFAYISELGLNKEETVLIFNATAEMTTNLGYGRKRYRDVSVVGDASVKKLIFKGDDRILVLNANYDDVDRGLQRAVDFINEGQSWKAGTMHGYIWPKQNLQKMKIGDLRVSRLTKHDVNTRVQMKYDYGEDGVGETALLADSLYTAALGNRFFQHVFSDALPTMKLQPRSRIVGFNDDDPDFIPGSKVMYPKVSVSNSGNDKNGNENGRTEFKYITPESGIPADYIDEDTKKELVPFVKFNLRFTKLNNFDGEFKNNKAYDFYRSYSYNTDSLDYLSRVLGKSKEDVMGAYAGFDEYNNHFLSVNSYKNLGRIFKFTLYNQYGNIIDKPKVIDMFENRLSQIFFYAENIKDAKILDVQEKINSTWTSPCHFNLNLRSQFNEYMLAVSIGSENVAPLVTLLWNRSQKEGMFPILYKKVEYAPQEIRLLNHGFFDGVNATPENGDIESNVTYYDFTGFLGQNYKTTFFRQQGNKEFPVKVDSIVYSTMVPDYLNGVATQDNHIRKKIGRQVERWVSVNQAQCKDVDADHKCLDDNADLMELKDNVVKKNFTHFRYSVFQVKSISYSGFDYQDDNAGGTLFNKTEISNHRFDPVTGSPTAALAVSKINDNLEKRKITQSTPFIALRSTGLSDSMFKRNMMNQTYIEEVYSGIVDRNSASNWNDVLMNNYDSLRSFTISPYRYVPDSLYESVPNSLLPIVSWGTYQGVVDKDKSIRKKAEQYMEAATVSGDTNFPNLKEFLGTNVTSVNSQLKVTESKDVQGRFLSSVYSGDGMYQLGLFFPVRKDDVGLVEVYADKPFAANHCYFDKNKLSVENKMLFAKQNTVVACTTLTDSKYTKEYRFWTPSQGWITKREIDSGKIISLNLEKKSLLNYFRVYPENAETKSYVYDSYGNMIQLVAEDNTSSFYEYNPLGQLVQIRNDDGLSFEAHHREYMNDKTK